MRPKVFDQYFELYIIFIAVFPGGSYFQPLSWNLRLKVALGAAKGLAFLHSAENKVIYRDFKTSNILLDSVRVTCKHNFLLSHVVI